MAENFKPTDIYAYLSQKVLGQDDVLRPISVAVYKHINGISGGNILLIGNSGTGKTTIMKSIRQFYHDHAHLDRYRSMVVMNANTLVDEEGEVNTNRIFKNLEADVHNLLGPELNADTLRRYMEHATVCFDEVDKVSSRISGKVNVTGILIQQALLTILEGETVQYETVIYEGETSRRVKFPLDTSKFLFVCGGAFEELYDQVYTLVEEQKDERRLKQSNLWDDEAGRMRKIIDFKLKNYLKLSDMFTYGMVPQFISRFSAIGILDDLSRDVLREIMLTAADSPLLHSRRFFESFDIELRLTGEALDKIATYAADNSRIGARALREVFTRIVARFEFDPFSSDLLREENGRKVLEIDRDTVMANISY
ncbi:MAG: AAA family ATPase [Acidobacteria bacterium]|nr:AAA family ATPase [Acidobacteriota bacterium]